MFDVLSRMNRRRRTRRLQRRRLRAPELLEKRWLLATWVVNSAQDWDDEAPGDGICDTGSVIPIAGNLECSLRAAIQEANRTPEKDRIEFNIPTTDPGYRPVTGSFVLRISKNTLTLPAITSPITIDGYSQPGATANTLTEGNNAVLKIELDGTLFANLFAHGLRIATTDSEIRGLVINRFGQALIKLQGGGGHKIEGNFLGTDVTGTQDHGAKIYGLEVQNSAGNLIGGTAPAARNLISGNDVNGIVIGNAGSTNNVVQGNFIGTTRTGMVALPNSQDGVLISAILGTNDYPTSNTIGGSTPGARNIISGNGNSGVEIYGGSLNRVQGNYIGVDVTGENDLGNAYDGVVLVGVNTIGNSIGGITDGEDNVISGNGQNGIELSRGAFSNVIQGNFIGTNKDGEIAIANGQSGILIDKSPNNIVGGTTEFAANLISGNTQDGVTVRGAESIGNKILYNLIGIDNLSTGARPNGGHGIHIDGAVFTEIGNTLDRALVVSGNAGDGIHITGATAKGNKLVHSFIGLNFGGGFAIPNAGSGVVIAGGAQENIIGAASDKPQNLISGNQLYGVLITDVGTDRNTVRGNFIGTDYFGEQPIGNFTGVRIAEGAKDTIISGNLISASSNEGVELRNAGENNRVQNNLIGTNKDGLCTLEAGEVCSLGNQGYGIFIFNTSKTLIGSPTNDADGNAIAFNGRKYARHGHGIFVASGMGNAIRRNSIFLNTGRGIDLGNPAKPDTFTLNDPKDTDDGANGLQDYPVVVAVQEVGAVKLIGWKLNSTPSSTFTIDFFANSEPDPSGFGEGEKFLSSMTMAVTTDVQGNVIFPTLFNASERFISATATDANNNTSEFSMVDTDGDALADTWETRGIDLDEDGVVDFQLPGTPDPKHKDLYVEVDAMVGLAPSQFDLDQVVTAFADAPVNNPDNSSGIALHAILDENTIPRQAWTGDLNKKGGNALGGDRNANGEVDHGEATDINGNLVPGDPDDQEGFPFFDQVKQKGIGGVGGFGTPAERANKVQLAAKRLVFRYAIFADHFAVPREGRSASCPDCRGGTELGISGIAEIGGNDFMVTLGAGWENTHVQRTGTFMHEFGHTLGLHHGGADDINNKPNYHSVMNYIWQYPQPWTFEATSASDLNLNGEFDDEVWVLNYSDRAFNTLDENGGLNENAGIGGHPNDWTLGLSPDTFVLEAGPVDWNGDGDVNDISVSADVNWDGNATQTLVGFDDWSNLHFSFLESDDFADGAPRRSVIRDMTLNEFEELNAIGPGPGILGIRLNTLEVDEDVGVATVTVTRGSGTRGAVTVDFASSDGTAIAGNDYTGVSGTLTFEDGEFVKTFAIPVIADSDVEGSETVLLTLTNLTGGAMLGSRATTTLTITNVVRPGVFEFGQSLTVINEFNGLVDITIVRTHGSHGSAQVTFGTVDGTAWAGSDYVAKTQTVLFGNGQETATVTVSLINDTLREHTETIGLSLINPTGGTTLGNRSFAQINLVDNDAPPGNLVVATTANSGLGSLRQAILDANVNPDHNLITFSIPNSGLQTIRPLSALPFLTGPVTIDGYTQPGTSPNTQAAGNNAVILIALDGSGLSSGHGIEIRAGGSAVRGLSIHSFPGSGVDLRIGSGNLVEGNLIGVGPSGTIFKGNGSNGVSITGSSDNVIGGADPASRNVISGNRFSGVNIHSSNSLRTIIQGNYIGTAANGIDPLRNDRDGIQSLGKGVLIGGRLPAEGNVIAFNGFSGINALFTGDDAPVVLSNSIHSNNPSELNNFKGIALVQADTAHNFPALSSALNVNGQGQIVGRIKSRPNIELLVQFFSNSVVDLSGHGEGKTFLGSTSVWTDANGNGSFIAALDQALTLGAFITSTATDFSRGNTSEFSARLPVGSALTSDLYTVNTTSDADDGFCDSDHCSLREAIFAANNHPGKDRIVFDITPGGVQTIAPGPAPLPTVTEPTVIDGTTQPGYSGTPIIELNGQNVVTQVHHYNTGLWILGGESEVRGIVINRFLQGIVLDGNIVPTSGESPGGNIIQHNYVGTDVSGTVKLANAGGINVVNSPNNLIGGDQPGDRNIVSGNSNSGIVVSSHTVFNASGFVKQYSENNRIEGNYVGTDVTGTVALGNGTGFNGDGITAAGPGTVVKNNLISANVSGILVWSPLEGAPIRVIGNYIGTDFSGTRDLGNSSVGIRFTSGSGTLGPRPAVIVGGSLASERNIISGNGSDPINSAGISFGGSSPLAVLGNYIGTDVTGTLAIPNANGVNVVGPRHIVENNLISGNLGYGVRLGSGVGTTTNTVARNLIGVSADGVSPLGNGADGVQLRGSGATDNVLGGATATQGNVIAHNGGNGISAGLSTFRNSFQSNTIFNNGGLGIELANNAAGNNDGPTPNDTNDADTGPNNLQNFPIIVSAESGTGITRVTTVFRGAPSTTIKVQFFSGGADPSGYGEARNFLGTTTTTTNSSGLASFVITFAGEVPVGEFVTATADQGGNTSEFSEATQVMLLPPQDGGVDTGSQAAFDSVQPAPALAVAQAGGPYIGNEGATITLNGSNSFAVGGTIVLYEWDLNNDGQFDDATGINTNVTFGDEGTFAVGLRVTDNTGHTDTATGRVTVYNISPTVSVGPDVSIIFGEPLVAIGSFTDTGADIWTATVDYEDGAGAQPLALNPDKTFTLSHQYAGSGIYAITVIVTDDDAGSGTDVLLVNVTNTVPATVDNGYDVDEDSALNIDAPGVLGNDTDAEGHRLTSVLVNGPSYGTLVLNPDGSFAYQSDPDFYGEDSFIYVANDGIADSNEATVTITVTEVNDIPIAGGDTDSVSEDSAHNSISVLGNDTPGPANETGQALTIIAATALHGTVLINGDGTLSYSPTADYNGPDTIRYTIQDNGTTKGVADPLTANGVVSVSVTPVAAVAAIRGTAFTDLSGNGLTPDDSPLADVTIKLYRDANGNGVLNVGTDDYVASTVTAADGSYAFPAAGNGTYFVNELVPSGYVRTYPLLSDTHMVQVSADTPDAGRNFANFQKCDKNVVSGIHYVINGSRTVNDLTGNVDEGDVVRVVFTIASSRSNVPLSLVSYKTPESVFVAETAYLQQIFDLDSGVFTGSGNLTVTVPYSFYQIDFVCGAAIDRFGPASSNIFYSAQNRLFDADNGGTPSSLAGFVYRDDNKNGVKGGKEPGISGVRITLTGVNDLNHSVSRIVNTSSSGAYSFGNLRPGTYQIAETQPNNYNDGNENVGTSGGVKGNDVFSSIVLAARVNGNNYNFGELKKNKNLFVADSFDPTDRLDSSDPSDARSELLSKTLVVSIDGSASHLDVIRHKIGLGHSLDAASVIYEALIPDMVRHNKSGTTSSRDDVRWDVERNDVPVGPTGQDLLLGGFRKNGRITTPDDGILIHDSPALDAFDIALDAILHEWCE